MSKKINSYQKLKIENQKLKQDIFNLVRKENELDGISTKVKYSMIFDGQDAIMFGSRSNDDVIKESSGILLAYPITKA